MFKEEGFIHKRVVSALDQLHFVVDQRQADQEEDAEA